MNQKISKIILEHFPDTWASGYGEDEYGVWQSFSVNGVVCRMRWIPPGTFMMGSPETEPERSNDEALHRVTFTHGFWLAEAASTQELWREIMGDNPSRFRGDGLPVDSVSWDDCQRFIEEINRCKPGLDLRLPTEAEWEYACRAGSVTPFSFGEDITTEQVNFNGNYPYKKGKKGAYRDSTVAVKSFLCNELGLYEMHGNIWEWCEDWYGEYPTGPVVDPGVPDTGSSRVIRGGGWVGDARSCRSAFRYGFPSVSRLGRFGFRLARGQTDGKPGGGPGEGVTAAKRSGRRSNPSRGSGGK